MDIQDTHEIMCAQCWEYWDMVEDLNDFYLLPWGFERLDRLEILANKYCGFE